MSVLLGLSVVLASTNVVMANSVVTNEQATELVDKQIEVLSIFGQHNPLETATGSAVVLDQLQLEAFEFDDIHRVLQSVPGVYIREEDGYGLRPNIGLRGATTERSSKIALMEDGVLIAPAPYAAPAAYYFPLVSRMSRVEVFKGPSAIKYGPNTIGGAINMVSRPITDNSPEEGAEALVDLAYGQDNYLKAHGVYSQNFTAKGYGQFGVLVEALTLNADGFKKLDNGENTGFAKNEFLVKLDYSPVNSQHNEFWQFKFAYADEVSHETYLGLTDADFALNATRRYLGSQNDKMDWEHYQFQLGYYIELSPEVSVFTQAYRQDFDRDWDRLNSFNTNRSMQTILTSPNTGVNASFMQVLKGERDSLTVEEDLLFTLNDRSYYSQGIESKLTWDTLWGDTDINLDAGLRFHQDNVERHHRVNYYAMQSQELVLTGQAPAVTTQNQGKATAVAGYTNVSATTGNLTASAGVRLEYIKGELSDYLANNRLTNSDTVILPGFGLFYQLSDAMGLLFGVNKGYVPTSPGQDTSVDPEESWNYELGWRFNENNSQAELVAFFNDYSNLKGHCSFSNGCQQTLDEEFNGGAINIYGVEVSAQEKFTLSSTINMPVKFAYTYTRSEFQNAFQSDLSLWGKIAVGDELPYLPEHQASLTLGLEGENWQANIIIKYIDNMREAAGTNTELSGYMTDELLQLDFSSAYQFSKQLKIYGKVDNLTDETVIVSRRPFGARPGKPRQVIVGVKYTF